MEGEIIKRAEVILLIVYCLVLFSPTDSAAWWSLSGSTHKHIAEDSLGLLSQTEYPDLLKYKGNIVSGTCQESHNTSQLQLDNDDASNGGYPQAFWDYAIYVSYKNNDYSNTYLNVGRMCHLIQDMGTPPHVANISHEEGGRS